MGGKNYYASGQFNVTCDVCSKKIKANKARHRWDGFLVCPSCFEPRHPQDFVRARQDKITVPDIRPIPALVYTNVSYPEYWDYFYTFEGYIVGDKNK